MNVQFGNYVISDDKALLQLEVIHSFLARSYWANKRKESAITQSIENSVCFGVYHEDKQIGFARIVTDGATMYWLCDVFIDEEYRGEQLGKKLIETITQADEFKGLTGLLGTLDAHGLYEQYGFKRDPDRFMRRAADMTSRP